MAPLASFLSFLLLLPSRIRSNPQPLDPKSLHSHHAKNKASFRGFPGPPPRLRGPCRLLLVSASLSLCFLLSLPLSLSPGTCAPPSLCPVLKCSPCLLSEAPFCPRPSAPSVWQTLLPTPHPTPDSALSSWALGPFSGRCSLPSLGVSPDLPPKSAAGLRGPV